MIDQIAKIIKVLNSETAPWQISLAVCFAMLAGLTPLISLHNIIVLLLVLTIRVNFSTFLVGLALFSGIAYLLDPLFHQIGLSVLTLAPLQPMWTAMYNSDFWRLAYFNNSVLCGSLVFALSLFIPLFFIARWGIIKYREEILNWVRKTRISQVFRATKLYGAYKNLSRLRNDL